MLAFLRRRWACLALLLVTLLDMVLVDPLPWIDEVVLAGLTTRCFRKHGAQARDED